jgi:4-hydroxy-3-polyprenylbenzoate decarboxylase
MDALYDRLVPGATPLRRPDLPLPPAAAWTPRKANE